jgi:hypothetical protein
MTTEIAVPENTKTGLPSYSLAASLTDLVGTDPAATWYPPRPQSPAICEAALDELDRIERAINEHPTKRQVAEWLGQLGVLTAGKMTADDARMRLAAYAGMLSDAPIGAFTRESLKRAARKFTWFPTFSEVSEFIDKEHWWLKAQKIRLDRIVSDGRKREAERRSAT